MAHERRIPLHRIVSALSGKLFEINFLTETSQLDGLASFRLWNASIAYQIVNVLLQFVCRINSVIMILLSKSTRQYLNRILFRNSPEFYFIHRFYPSPGTSDLRLVSLLILARQISPFKQILKARQIHFVMAVLYFVNELSILFRSCRRTRCDALIVQLICEGLTLLVATY